MRYTLTIILASCLAFGAPDDAAAESPPPPMANEADRSGPAPLYLALSQARELRASGEHRRAAEAIEERFAEEAVGDAVLRRDGHHMLGHARLAAGDYAAAVEAFERALELGRARGSRTSLEDVMRFGLARALFASGDLSRAERELRAIDGDPHTPHKEDALRLRLRIAEAEGDRRRARALLTELLTRWPDSPSATEARVRAAALDLELGRRGAGLRALAELAQTTPQSRAGLEARLLLEAAGARVPLNLEDPTFDDVDWLMSERRYEEVLPRLAVLEDRARTARVMEDARRAMETRLRAQYLMLDFEGALATHEAVTSSGGDGLTDFQLSRTLAHLGDAEAAEAVYLTRYRGRRGAAYWNAVGDLAYEFGRYGDAYEAYVKARQRGRQQVPHNDRMVWCLLRMGEAAQAAEHLRAAGGAGRSNARIEQRYWYGRALGLAGDAEAAREAFDHLVADAPHTYYGVQAWSRLAELDGRAPEPDDNAIPGATIHWSPAAVAGAFAEAPTRAPQETIEAALDALVAAWGELAPEVIRARELAGLGMLDAATAELRVLDMELRAAGFSGASALAARARADLLDNRRQKKARGGATLRDPDRRTRAQARALARERAAIRRDLRPAQIALADPYGIRRSVFEAHGRAGETNPEVWREAYPIAWPELVGTFARQFAVPPYYLYSIMVVESAYHPHAISVSDAHGLLQVIPRTGRRVAEELGFAEFSPELLLEPAVGIYFGTYYLGQALRKFREQEPLAAAAYNAGPHRVAAWLRARGQGPMDMFIEEIPFNQARAYTKSMIRHLARYRRIYHGEDHTYVSNALDPAHLPHPNY